MQEVVNFIATVLLARFMLNDIPHMLSDEEWYHLKDYRIAKFRSASESPPTPAQLRYISQLCQQLGIKEPYEEEVKTQGEAGRLIRELEAERRYRRQR